LTGCTMEKSGKQRCQFESSSGRRRKKEEKREGTEKRTCIHIPFEIAVTSVTSQTGTSKVGTKKRKHGERDGKKKDMIGFL